MIKNVSKTLCTVSQNQVLINTSSNEEAKRTADALSRYDIDTIDDALNRLPAVELELKAQQGLVEELNMKVLRIGDRLSEKDLECIDLQEQIKKFYNETGDTETVKVEKPLGKSKKTNKK